MDLRRKAAIAGIWEHPSRQLPGRTRLQIHAECAINALKDAGLTMKDVDALYTGGLGSMEGQGIILAEYLNINPKMIDDTDVGGASYEAHVAHALANIATGRVNVALLTYGDNPNSSGRAVGTRIVGTRRRDERAPRTFPANYLELPWGMPLVGNYALVARRHMHQYGTKPEQLAEIAVAVRGHASRNPSAKYRDPITVDDVVNSRYIAEPLHMLDCCVVSDGGGAVVVVSAEVARTLKKKPAWVMGVGEGYQHTSMGKRDITYIGAHRSNEAAWAMADVKPKDIDILMVYDSFTITALCSIEDLGFCKKGEGGAFVEKGRLTLEGDLPLNTDGGGLSSNHPGRRGIFLLIEATRQLRGESTSQVKNAKLAMAHGTGGYLTTRHSGETVILSGE